MYKQVILVRKDLKLGAGKVAAQVAHAAIGSMNKVLKANQEIIRRWEIEGSRKVVLKVKDLREMKDIENAVKKEKITYFIVRDAGCTQVKPGTVTALGIGPDKEEKIDKVTCNIKLL